MTTCAAGFVVLFALLVLASCLHAFVRPQWLFDFAKPMLERSWLIYLGAGIRLALGLALLFVADQSAFPTAFTIFGWIMLVAAVAIPFIGMPRVKALIDWMETLPSISIRLWVLVGMAFGAFLLVGVYDFFA